MSQISGPGPIASTPGQTTLASGPSSTPLGVRADVSGGGPAFASGSLWAAQIAAVSPRGFVLLVAGVPFDIEGRPPGPQGTALLVRAELEEGGTVFHVVPAPQAARAAEALRLALGHFLHRALGARPAAPLPLLTGATQTELATVLADAVHERLTEPSATLAEYLSKGILRLEVPIATPEGEAMWQLEVDPNAAPAEEAVEAACSVTLFATLPVTGPVEARLTLTRETLAVRFVLASDEACARVDAHRHDLEAALSELGFAAVRVEATASPAQLARDRATDAVPHETPISGGLLDIRA